MYVNDCKQKNISLSLFNLTLLNSQLYHSKSERWSFSLTKWPSNTRTVVILKDIIKLIRSVVSEVRHSWSIVRPRVKVHCTIELGDYSVFLQSSLFSQHGRPRMINRTSQVRQTLSAQQRWWTTRKRQRAVIRSRRGLVSLSVRWPRSGNKPIKNTIIEFPRALNYHVSKRLSYNIIRSSVHQKYSRALTNDGILIQRSHSLRLC